eukprot:TRINITY_DN9549_c0_g1_i1.p1 TRINITY_DN9549_c0_g1~~TRINITY_DN9549_c0_g1_i1.p1  ORF type:complete len:336 (+),score=115.89 TRINITY_DN9549_c0_g1_i1:68-1009(+)
MEPQTERRATAPSGEWLSRVRRCQRTRLTPEQIDAARRRSDARTLSLSLASRSATLQQAADVSTSAWMAASRTYATDTPQLRAERSVVAREAMRRTSVVASAGVCGDAGAELEDIERSVALVTPAAARGDSPPSGDAAELAQLLDQVRREPDDDAEKEEKFSLYEGFAESVASFREELHKFWEESKGVFEGSALTTAERAIAAMDRAEMLAIYDREDVWFVHGMLTRAHANMDKFKQVIADLRRKLELLGRQDECPVCLDALDGEDAHVLGCCHKVCAECWANWVEVTHRMPFCPLCRSADFIDRVLSAGEPQ